MIEIKTIHDAAEVLRHPENFYSHHKADALEIAKKLLLEVDEQKESEGNDADSEKEGE